MKKLFFTGLLVLAFGAGYAQGEVKIQKDDIAYLDGKPLLKVEKVNILQYSFYTLDTDDEILLYRNFDNETPSYQDDDYYTLNFLQERVKVESQDYSKIINFMNSRKAMEKLLKWLVKEKVITPEGKVDKDRLDIFFSKYDENITNRTQR